MCVVFVTCIIMEYLYIVVLFFKDLNTFKMSHFEICER